jgi:hypothetical protein
MQTRGVKTLDFAGTKEEVYERNDWPREKFQVRAASPFIVDGRNTSRTTLSLSSDTDLKGIHV